MTKTIVSEALHTLALHALDYQKAADAIGDKETAFIWHELRAMLRGYAELKRSPLHDELRSRIGQKPHGAEYHYSRLAAIAAVYMLMNVQSWSRARACKAVGRLTGVNPTILEKKMGVPSDLRDGEALIAWEHFDAVMAILESSRAAAIERHGRTPTNREWFRSILRLAKSNVEAPEHTEWRREMIAKAMRARPNEQTNRALLVEITGDTAERLTTEL